MPSIETHRRAQAPPSESPKAEILSLGAVIRAGLSGADKCAVLGLTTQSSSPVIALCRDLIRAGHDPATPLEAYRGEALCLRVRSIGEAAQLRVATHGVGFEPAPECTGGPPVRQNASMAHHGTSAHDPVLPDDVVPLADIGFR